MDTLLLFLFFLLLFLLKRFKILTKISDEKIKGHFFKSGFDISVYIEWILYIRRG